MTTATKSRKPSASKKQSRAKADGDAAPAVQVVSKPIAPLIAIPSEIRNVELSKIIDPPGAADRLPREGDHERIVALAESLQRYQQQSPIAVEQLADGRLVRIYGRRRIAAAKLAGWNTIEARVYPPLDEDVRRALVAIENIDRQDLTPAEETIAVGELLELHAMRAAMQYGRPLDKACGAYGGNTFTLTQLQDLAGASTDAQNAAVHDLLLDAKVKDAAVKLVAGMLSKPETWVRDRAYVLRLSKKALALVQAGKLPLAHAREISKVGDSKRRDELAEYFAAGGELSISDTEPGKLEELREMVGRSLLSLAQAPWRPDAENVGGRPPCVSCPHNSATTPGLFEGGAIVSTEMRQGAGINSVVLKDEPGRLSPGVCTNRSCYEDKLVASKKALATAAKKIVDAEPAAKKGKNGKAAPTPAGPTAAAFLRPEAVEAKVKDRRDMLKHRAKHDNARGPKPSAAQAEKVRLQNLKTEAKRQWQTAMMKRAQASEGPIGKALAKKPGAWAVMKLVLSSKPYEATHDYNDAKCERALASSRFLTLVNSLADPCWDAVVAIEKECGRQFALFDAWRDGPSGVVDLIAKALGVDLPEAPALESFYPKELREASKAKGVTESDLDEVDAEDEGDEE